MANDAAAVNLKILSPNFEGDISLPDLAAATTVKELRVRIQAAMASRPATERMRLIYRGRVVVNELDTLSDVFGPENIRNSKEQSLHLVLRELPGASTASAPSPSPRSSTAPPNPFRPVPPPPQTHPLQTNPFRTLPQTRPNSQPPQLPHPHHHHHHHHHPQQAHNPFGHLPIPPELQQHFAQTINQNLHQHQHQHQQHNAQNPLTPTLTPTLTPNQPSQNSTPAPAGPGQAPPPGVAPAVSPGPMNLPPTTTRTIRHEALGPNGERWTMTVNDTNFTIPVHPHQQPFLPRAFPHPPGFANPPLPLGSPPPRDLDSVLNVVRAGLESVRQDLENAIVLLQPPRRQPVPVGQVASVTPSAWRIQRIRYHLQSTTPILDRVQRGLTHVLANPSNAQNRDILFMQEAATIFRAQVEELNGMLDRLRDMAVSDQASSNENPSSDPVPSSSSVTHPQAVPSQTQSQQSSNHPSLADVDSELFILSSPQGPVGILFDQRGMYSTAPMGPTLPFQTFNQQFLANRHVVAGTGQQITHNASLFHREAHATDAAGAAQAAQIAQLGQRVAEQPPAPIQGMNLNPPRENERLVEIAGHLWLVFKLLCFIYIFAGGGGWYRPAMMGIVAVLVVLAQAGIFEDQFAAIRRHFEALLPLADRAGPDRNRQAQNPAPGEPRTEPNQNLTPGEAAQRLVRQHHENRFAWVRDVMRTTERAFALFVASLWPGIGERMVQAQEERVRLAAEAQRLEEEARQQQAQEAQEAQEAEQNEQQAASESKSEPKPEESSSDVKSSRKGKERAEEAEVAEEGSSS